MEYVALNNGIRCPAVGIGTFMLAPADAENSVKEALKMGCRLVDTANAYVNERAVGRGIKASGVPREAIFLSTKPWPSEYENEHAVDETLERLEVADVDLLYIHQPAGNWLAGYRQLEKAYREGRPRPSAFPILKADTSQSWRKNGRSFRSLCKRRPIPISPRQHFGRRWKSTVSSS